MRTIVVPLGDVGYHEIIYPSPACRRTIPKGARVPRELHDGFGRGINYLRISVTDKCNFRCVYCMPEEGVAMRAHDELLSAEEIAHFVRLVAPEGITRVRLTGGEPLVSHRIVPLIEEIRAIDGIEDISLTTNGALLPRLAPALREAGLDRVNISLDTLNADRFTQITRLGRVEQALAGIDAALEYGFEPVKVNTVVVRRMDQDVLELAKLSLERPVHVRFIEYMPIGSSATSPCPSIVGRRTQGVLPPRSGQSEAPEEPMWSSSATSPCPSIVGRRTQGVLPPRSGQSEAPEEPMWSSSATSPHRGAGTSGCSGSTLNPELWDASDVVPSDELRELISSQARAMGIGALAPVDESAPYGAGPARYWAFPNAAGTVGFISAMSNHFCSACNRLRLTADGQLRPCLFSDAEYNVRDALRTGDDEAVVALYRTAIAHKPQQHDHIDGTQRFMSQIGG
jgi:cyclic pyranopterin phosphate synthase